MSSECKREEGKYGKSPGNEFNGIAVDRRSSSDVSGHQNSQHFSTSGQEWVIGNQHRSPRDIKTGNLEKNSKSRKESRASTSPAVSIQHAHMPINSTHVFHSDAEVASCADVVSQLSLGARPKTFPRCHGITGNQKAVSQIDKVLPKSKLENIRDKMINTDEITAKLKQIREYIDQITAAMRTLENSRDPSCVEKLERLRNVRTVLMENEHQLLELLEKLAILSRDSLNEQNAYSDACFNLENRGSNQDEFSDASESEQQDEVENVNQDMNNSARDGTTDAFARHSEILKEMAKSQEKLRCIQDHQAILLNLKRQVESQLSNTRALHQDISQQNLEMQPEDLNRDERPPPVGRHQAQENRQRRLPFSQEERSFQENHEVNLRDQSADSKFRELDKKWLGLQKERDQMDLLRELHLMQDNRMLESASLQRGERVSSFEQNCSPSKRNSINPILVDCELDNGAVNDKTIKVEDKNWLKSLQGIESKTPMKMSSIHNDQIPKIVHPENTFNGTRDESQSRLKKQRKSKTSNLSFNKDGHETTSAISPKKSSLSGSEINQRLDSLLSDLQENFDSGQYEETKNKLTVAREKLQKLQNILAVVQQSPIDGDHVQEEFIDQLLESVDGEELIHNEVQNKENVRCNASFKNQIPSAESALAKDANGARSSRKFTFDNPKQTQRMDPVGMNDSRRESNSGNDMAPRISQERDANNELWMEMRRQQSLTEELRQRRLELESLMRKDAGKSYFLNQDIRDENQSAKSEPLRKSTASVVADSMSAATWGGSSVENETQATIDETNDSQEEKTEVVEDEEYSSDGQSPRVNGQLEHYDSRASKITNRTSPIVVIPENRRPSRSNPAGATGGTDFPAGDTSLSVGKRSIQTQYPSFHAQEQLNEVGSNVAGFEDQPTHDTFKAPVQNTNLSAGLTTGVPNQTQHPLESTSLLYQTFLRDQHIMDGLARQSLLVNPNGPISTFQSSDAFTLQQIQLQQQMLLGLSQCYKLLYLQNVETQRLHQFVQNCLSNGGATYSEPCLPYHNHSSSCDAGESRIQAPSSQWHRETAPVLNNTSSHRISSAIPPTSTITDSHETLNNQVAPGNRANNYWDNFRSYSRQNLLSNSHHLNKINLCESHEHVRQPSFPQEQTESYEDRLSASRPTRSSDVKDHSDSSVIQIQPKNKVNKEPGHLGSDKFHNRTVPNAKTLINCGNLLNNSSKVPSSRSPSAVAADRSRREVSCELPANSTRREGEIQNVVTKLISRCYGDSGIIVDLLRELQKLNSQQEFSCALQVIRNFVTDYGKNHGEAGCAVSKPLTSQPKESSSSDADVEMRTLHLQGCLPKQDRPRYSFDQDSSTDDDSIPHWTQARKNRHSGEIDHHPFDSSDRSKLRSQHPTQEGKVCHGSAKKSFHSKNSGANRKLHKNRTALNTQLQSSQQDESHLGAAAALPTSEERSATKPNADDLATSDVPSPRFNIRQLETQMQDVMSSVTSFVSLLSSRSFNSSLMGIITSRMIDLVLSMVDNLNEYTMSFVPGHLESVLSNILPKYVGKRVSECESNLVTELSEILFNELALLQLMQNMVNGKKSLKLPYPSFDSGRNSEFRPSQMNAGSFETQTLNAGYSSPNAPKTVFTEATDADLVLTTKRGDDDENEKSKEDFSCDIPDVCVSHENSAALSNVLIDERSSMFRSVGDTARLSLSNSSLSHRDSHNPTPLQLPELGGSLNNLEEARYFDLEVELEEGIGDTQDLAEADQTHRYVGLESHDDDVHDECVENWSPNQNFCNGDMERTEDDQQDGNMAIGAVGGVSNAYQNNAVDGVPTRMEATLDEVPIKLRVNGSGQLHESLSESDTTRKSDGSNLEKQG